jgi:hypothetical protein
MIRLLQVLALAWFFLGTTIATIAIHKQSVAFSVMAVACVLLSIGCAFILPSKLQRWGKS